MSKIGKTNINKIVKENPRVDSDELLRNIKILQDLERTGINLGPNYNLGSPYARPEPQDDQDDKRSNAIRLRNVLP